MLQRIIVAVCVLSGGQGTSAVHWAVDRRPGGDHVSPGEVHPFQVLLATLR